MREETMEFSVPFMSVRLAMVLRKPEAEQDIFSFLRLAPGLARDTWHSFRCRAQGKSQ